MADKKFIARRTNNGGVSVYRDISQPDVSVSDSRHIIKNMVSAIDLQHGSKSLGTSGYYIPEAQTTKRQAGK